MAEAERIVATILGCGSSAGVPRIGNIWGTCDPANPRNRRRRCALLLTGTTPGHPEPTQVLIDTGPDVREQMLDADVRSLAAVLYTHEHADHTHGIDDLRVLALNNRKRVDVYFSAEAGERIVSAFAYCFTGAGGYPPILNQHIIAAGETLRVHGPGGTITVDAFRQQHGEISSLGFRVASFAYSCDLSGIPPESEAAVAGLDTWVIDALRPVPHPSHLSLPESIELISRMRPRQAVLTNLHVDMDYEWVGANTPDNVTPAFDGMQIDISSGRVLNA